MHQPGANGARAGLHVLSQKESCQMKTTAVTVALALACATTALAQPNPHAGHGAGKHGDMAKQDYMAGMQRMHQAMMRADDADPDRAFALKMIEHHRGGVAMVDVLMKHGDDAELKRMGEKTKAMQLKEIEELQGWLDRHGGRTPRK
jgi:uncharacterized protein (DUF305 family)